MENHGGMMGFVDTIEFSPYLIGAYGGIIATTQKRLIGNGLIK
jgi:hypothetical protein